VQKNIEVDTSAAQAVIKSLEAEAQADAIAITSAVEADIQDKTIRSKANAYKIISDITKQTAADTLMDYIYYTNLLNVKNATVLVGVEDAQLNMHRMSGKGY
jgi:vacuolar-type H+-ATPase subunit F/Vma7